MYVTIPKRLSCISSVTEEGNVGATGPQLHGHLSLTMERRLGTCSEPNHFRSKSFVIVAHGDILQESHQH